MSSVAVATKLPIFVIFSPFYPNKKGKALSNVVSVSSAFFSGDSCSNASTINSKSDSCIFLISKIVYPCCKRACTQLNKFSFASCGVIAPFFRRFPRIHFYHDLAHRHRDCREHLVFQHLLFLNLQQ